MVYVSKESMKRRWHEGVQSFAVLRQNLRQGISNGGKEEMNGQIAHCRVISPISGSPSGRAASGFRRIATEVVAIS